MRVVLLAGGRGTRLQEETTMRPKPMVDIGGRPILWHIMKHYAQHGCKDFYVALGYMGDYIKSYFFNQYNLSGALTIDFAGGGVGREQPEVEDWRVNLIDTGIDTLTGGRVLRLRRWLKEESFMLTYGDGVSNVDLTELLRFHKQHGRLATITAVRPPARFGGLILDGPSVASFTEKPIAGEGWINGGFMVLEPRIFDYLDGDKCSLERACLERLAADGELAAYQHGDFWQCMDTLRDKNYLESEWEKGDAAWKTWSDPSEVIQADFNRHAA